MTPGIAVAATSAPEAAAATAACSGPRAARVQRVGRWIALALCFAAALLGGCATLSAPAASPPAAAASSPPAAAAALPQPQAFDTLIRGATRVDGGPVVAWQKNERIWLEIAPEQFGQPFLLAPALATGIGEDFIYGGLLRTAGLVEFRRIHNVVQLILLNTRFTATPGTPEARSVATAYSPSLLGSTAIASLPHPQRHSVLIDAGQIFLGDVLGLGLQLQRTYRQGYTLDPRNTLFRGARARGQTLLLEVSAHYATASISRAPPGAPPGTPVPTLPDNLPDVRSLFLGVNYALMRLPEQPLVPRRADPRVGYFITVVDRYDDDLERTPRQRYAQRWRLEKQDPDAARSPPLRPITFWLDRTIPLQYRDAIRSGILEWNRAFEPLGFEGAVTVREADDDEDLGVPQAGEVVVRWLSDSELAVSALATPQVDPRSGEILHAGIVIEDLAVRLQRSTRSHILPATLGGGTGAAASGAIDPAWARLLQLPRIDTAPPPSDWEQTPDARVCLQGSRGAEQLAYGLSVRAAIDDIAPDSPEAQRFVLDFVKETAMHEAGHALGLKHNFRGSRRFGEAELSDPDFTRSHGLSASIMDYLPINLPRPGAPAPAAFQTMLGAYDYWAIEYGYRPLAAADESAALARIAARNSEPGLEFGSDEDTFLGIDPEALQFDLGNDELAFAARRFDIVQELFRRQQTRLPPPGRDWAELRRSIGFAVSDAVTATGIALRQIGGVRTLRDYPNTGRDPLQPLPAAEQRAALDFIARRVLDTDWAISPALERRLAPDFLDRSESPSRVPTEISVAFALLELQRAVLNQLMSDPIASRILQSESMVDRPDQAFRLAELYRGLDAAVWGDLGRSDDIPLRRRELQREHANRLAALVLRPGALTRSDARALVRNEARRLLARVQAAARRAALDNATRVHLLDVADTLRSALAAPLQRAGV